MGKINYYIHILGVVFVLFVFFGCTSDNSIIIIEEPTELLLKPDDKHVSGNKVIAILEKGEQGNFVHVRYSKDAMFYKINLRDGRIGYVMSYGRNLRVVESRRE